MDLIDRYIYAVTQRLPEKQRADIKKELQGLIEDMLEERTAGGKPSREDAEDVLLELGPPNALAAKYRGYERYLIGPALFDSYLTTLRVVLISVLLVMTGLFFVETIASYKDILQHFTDYIVTLITAGAQGFGWVTLVFAIIEYSQSKDSSIVANKNKAWKPSDLPQIPDANSQIKLSEPIAAIFFTVLFTAIFLNALDVIGVWTFEDGERTFIPFLNVDVFLDYLPIIWLVAALGILKECVRILIRKRTGRMLVFHIFISVVTTILSIVVLADSGIWNPDFIAQMQAAELVAAGSEGYDTVVSIWNGVHKWAIPGVIVIMILEIIGETFKWYKARSTV